MSQIYNMSGIWIILIEDINHWEQNSIIENKNKTVEIANLAKKANSKIYLVIYPWPGQLVNRNEIFSWTDFVDDLCNISNCNGVKYI